MRASLSFYLSIFSLGALLCASVNSFAATGSCSVPLNESFSAPSIDLIQNGASIDRDYLLTEIKSGFDSSVLQPQLSKLYRGQEQSLVQYADMPYPGASELLRFVVNLGSVSRLIRSRVVLDSNPNQAYQLNFSLDTHAALARNALLRKLGYSITTPKYYPKVRVQFSTLIERDQFLETLGGDTITSRGRWVLGGLDEIKKNNLTLTLLDGVIEPATVENPQMHWGIFRQDETVDTLASRRSLRALLVPLTLLDVSESVNMYSFEPAKIFDETLVFTRANANLFKDETSIGDVRWIAKKIAGLTRADWTAILRAGHYPIDIEALLIEKTIGRTNQLMSLLDFRDFTPLPYDEYISYGAIINGKATQELYDNYPERFIYGDPQSPLRASELSRFFGIELVNGGLSYALEKAASYLQVITPEKYVTEHGVKTINDIVDHFTNHPDQPYIQPISIFGGPVIGGNVNASRNIVTGTYYGSSSQIQLVDSLSATVSVGGFFGIAGLPKVGVALAPNLQYNRSYVHVRPLTDVKSAWKDKWSNILVPKFMTGLSSILAGKTDQDANAAITAFFSKMNTGEMFIVTDGLTAGGIAQAQIPIGAIMGLISPYSTISADLSLGLQYAILSRTTIYKTADGLHVYLSRIKSGNFEMSLGADFFIRVLTATNTSSRGSAHTMAYVFPNTFDKASDASAFQRSLRQILRSNNPEMLEEEFKAYVLDHTNNGHRFKLTIGPWSWSNRENFHQLEITPPIDSRYQASDFKRTVIQGEITKISGSDFFGLFGSMLKSLVPFINIGNSAVGDDPSSNFLGKSKTFDVNTEIEITPSRPNRTFTRIQQAHTGWTLSKNRFLKLVNKISDQLGDFSPAGGLVNPSEFAQTRSLQAYTILWNVLIYEKGLNQILTTLNGETSNTANTQNFLIGLMGQGEYEQFCMHSQLKTTLQQGPYVEPGTEGTLVESINGQMTLVGCVTPWMKTVYGLRAELSQHPEVFKPEVRSVDDTKEKIRWINRILSRLNNELDISQLIHWVGKENSFFQVRVSGFRTHDENGDSKGYFSNTVGTIDPDTSAGPISDISDTTQISSHELEARYLSNGY